MSDQLDLGLQEAASADPAEHTVRLQDFALTPESTPAAIVVWWDDLVQIFTTVAEQAKQEIVPIDAELTALSRPNSGEPRRRKRMLIEKKTALLDGAEAVEFEAYALFEATLSEFSPTLISPLQAAGLDIPDDYEMAVANFWDCLERPVIEHLADVPLREIIRLGFQPTDP